MEKDITDSFQRYFEMVPATTESLKEAVYRLRYQIYCLETGFLQSQGFPDGLEKDEYDDSSEHYLIRHRETGIFAATTRLILPDPSCPQRPFPTECLSSWVNLPQRFDNVFRRRLGEASRFCVSNDFKRRPGELGTTTGARLGNLQNYMTSEDERRIFPHITLALLACLVRMSARRGITHWYAFMEASLIRLFKLLGLYWIAIGPITDFHGRRQPCIIELAEFLERVKKRNVQVWDMLTDYGKFWLDDKSLARPALGNLRVADATTIKRSSQINSAV